MQVTGPNPVGLVHLSKGLMGKQNGPCVPLYLLKQRCG